LDLEKLRNMAAFDKIRKTLHLYFLFLLPKLEEEKGEASDEKIEEVQMTLLFNCYFSNS